MMPFQTDKTWTTSTYRLALDAWRANAPKTDGDIFPEPARPAPGKRPDAVRLAPLKRWRQLSSPPEPTATNFLQADNDNSAAPGIDRGHEIRPSISAILREMKHVEIREFRHAKLGGGGGTDFVPVGGDVERSGPKRDGPIIRIGRLEFSRGGWGDHAQAERCLILDEFGKVRLGAVRMPLGALLNSVDRSGEALGPAHKPAATATSNKFFAQLLGTAQHRFIKGGKRRAARDIPTPPLPPTSIPLNEARAFAGLPPTEKLPTGLPCGSPCVADSFLAFASIGKRPVSRRQDDIESSLSERQEHELIRASLADTDVAALDAAMTAQNYEEVGRALGRSGPYAKRAGKRALVAANDNLDAALKKIAS